MRVLGVKSVKVTNARGFCLEISTAITVVLASRFGVPSRLYDVHVGATTPGSPGQSAQSCIHALRFRQVARSARLPWCAG